MGIDLQKEIKLSDLFRRKGKKPENAPKERKPRRALFARAPKEPKPPKPGREKKAAVAARSAPDLPQIPLMRAFNLLPREEARDSRGRLGLAQVLVALVGLLVVAGLGGGYLFMSAGVGEKRAEADDLRVQLAELDVPSEGPEQKLDPSLTADGQARTAALATALGRRIAWDRVLRQVSLVVPEDVWIDQITAGGAPAAPAAGTTDPAAAADPAATPLSVAGGAESQDAVARYLARLAVIPELGDVRLQVSERKLQDGGDVVYGYTIVASVGAPGAAS